MAKTYEVRISGELARTIEVEAEDANEAYDKVCQMWKDCEIVLDADDFVGELEVRVGGRYGDILDEQARKDLAGLYNDTYKNADEDTFWSILQCVGCEREFRRYLSEQE
jgi:hypothetical protein